MADFKQRPDSGRLMASDSKKSEKSPDYWGEIAINIKDLANVRMEDGLHVFRLSGWKKRGASGKAYLSLAIDRREKESPKPKRVEEMEDDLDF